MTLQVGDEYHLTIVDVALPDGYGVARLKGMVVFVPGGVPGDIATVRISKLDRRFAYGAMTRLVQASPHRVAEDTCSRFGECGGCELQVLDYKRQLEIKENHLVQVLTRIGGVDLGRVTILPIVPSVDLYYYRSKIELLFGRSKDGTTLGLSERALPRPLSERRIVAVDGCRLFSPLVEELLPPFREFFSRTNLAPYDSQTGS